jgi:NTP pyrophosphatase (non-canonical NTP hydrolase)
MEVDRMNLNEYLQLRKRTDNENLPHNERVLNYLLGMGGETGEIQDEFKKHLFHEHEFNIDRVIKELGDDFWYRFGLMDLLGITLEEVLEANIKKLKGRYPEGFDSEKSKHRQESE